MGFWLMVLILETSLGQHDMGVLHHKNGQLARFPTKEACEQMAASVLAKAREQYAAGKLDPQITNVHLSCYQPTRA